jgi:putative transposase
MMHASICPSKADVQTATKSISFKYSASQELFFLFENFRLMCNDAVRIAVNESPKNRFELQRCAYPRLKEYGLHSHYILTACEVAYTAYRNKNRKKVPYIRRSFVKLDSVSYRLDHLLLRIPITPRRFIFLILRGSDYHNSFIDDPNLKRGALIINEQTVCIAFSRISYPAPPIGFIGMDVNEKNVTISATNGYQKKFDELAEVVEIRERYGEIRAKIDRITGCDKRIAKKLLAKYGRRERNRTVQRVHGVTKKIVDYSFEHGFGIKMEKLTGIRRLFRKGKAHRTSLRRRMNTWVFRETQWQTEYKAKWKRVPVWFVSPRGTSRNCPDCGSRVAPLAGRKLYCPKCDLTWDRDDLASKNIMACVVPQVRPSKRSNEMESRKLEDAGNPSSRWEEVKLDGSDKPKS